MSAEILFTIHDFNIRKDALYQVIPKLDTEAPDGFKEYKTTKLINPDISNIVPGAIYDRAKGAWDTGFYVESTALGKAIPNATERAKVVKDLDKLVIKPIEALKGKDRLSAKSPDNDKYWDEFVVDIYKDKIFNTAKPEELLQLYLLLLHKQLIPSHLESHPDYKVSSAQYCVIDKEDAVDRKLQSEMENMEANGIFFRLMNDKKSDLIMLLDYLGVPVSGDPENAVLVSMFSRFLKDKTDGFQNARVFIKGYEKFTTEAGENEVYFHSKLKKLFSKGKVKQRKGEIVFDEEVLGNSFKLAAARVASDPELQKQLLEIE